MDCVVEPSDRRIQRQAFMQDFRPYCAEPCREITMKGCFHHLNGTFRQVGAY